MLRHQLLSGLLALHPAPRYLEIGVLDGVTFSAVSAAQKVGVDPRFRFAAVSAPGVTFHEVASDVYFGEIASASDRFEVIFIDGLHTSEQTLRDLMNSIDHLADGGVIVIDDITPSSFASAQRSMADARRVRERMGHELGHDWMGDVYRLAFFIESFLQGFSYGVVQETHGQLVLWREPRRAVRHPERTIEWIGRADLMDMMRHDEDFGRAPYAGLLARYAATLNR